MSSNLEYVLIEWSKVCLLNIVRWWPLIKIEVVGEYVGVKKRFDFDTFLDKCREVFVKEKTAYKVVLILDDVLNYDLDCSNLIVSQSAINCRSVKEFVILSWTLLDLIFVEEWEFFAEILYKIILEEICHWSGIKWQDRDHIWAIEFKECFVEDWRIWLIIYNVYNLR